MAARSTVSSPAVAWTCVLWLSVALAGCAGRQEISRPPTTPSEDTYEQGIPEEQQAEGSGGSQAGSGGGGAGGGEAGGAEGGDGAGEAASAQGATAPPGSAMTPGEQSSSAERALEESLAEYGEQLRQARESAARTGADPGDSAGGETSRPSQDSGTGGGGSPGVEAEASSRGPGGKGTATPADPENIPDGSDDDVVARQLREMAENEQDPELRAIYWQEYLDYKSGERRSPPEEGEPEKDDENESKDDAEDAAGGGDSRG